MILQLGRSLHHHYDRFFPDTGVFADTAANAFITMYYRFHDGMRPGAFVVPWNNGNSLIDQRTLSIADFTTETANGETIFTVNNYRGTHPDFFYIIQLSIKSAGWTGFGTWHIRTEIAGNFPCYNMRSPYADPGFGPRHPDALIGAGLGAFAAFDARAKKPGLFQSSRRTEIKPSGIGAAKKE
jgi:hypothetical protein